MYYKNLNINGTDFKIAVNIAGAGAPTTATEGVVGMIYMNTNNGDLYKCTSVLGSTYTWVEALGVGADGFSPTIAVTNITGGHRITITDKNGTKTVDVMDGTDGKNGSDGTNGKDGRGIKSVARTSGTGAAGTTDTYTITYSDNTTSTFTVYNGKNGTNGKDGSNGTDGVSISSVTQTTTSSADGGANIITVTLSDGTKSTFTVKNGSKGSSGKDGQNGSDGKDGNGIKSAVLNADYTLTLTFDNGTNYTTPSIRGANGTNGKDGTSVTVSKVTESTASGGSNVVTFSDGKTLTVKNGKDGQDYILTEADKENIAAMAAARIRDNGVIGYVDEDNNIVLSGNIADGTYTVKYEMADGSTVDIGELKFAYSVTNKLTYCINSNSATSVANGGSYSATISANSGYEMKSVTVTMGGTNITSSAVSGGNINIASVTGNIVITAVAEKASNNLLPNATNKDGTPYVGDNGEKGYRVGYRIKSSGDESASSGAYCTGFMPVSATSYDDYIYVKNFTLSTTDVNNAIALYDTSKNKIFQSAFATTGYAWVTLENDVLKFRILNMATNASQAAFFRFSCGGITDETIVTVNEKIE